MRKHKILDKKTYGSGYGYPTEIQMTSKDFIDEIDIQPKTIFYESTRQWSDERHSIEFTRIRNHKEAKLH